METVYEKACSDFGWPVDVAEIQAMHAANAAKLQELEGAIKDAEENLGDTEVCTMYTRHVGSTGTCTQVREALFNKAMFLYNTGEREAAQAAFKATEEKTAGIGQKLDCTFAVLRYEPPRALRTSRGLTHVDTGRKLQRKTGTQSRPALQKQSSNVMRVVIGSAKIGSRCTRRCTRWPRAISNARLCSSSTPLPPLPRTYKFSSKLYLPVCALCCPVRGLQSLEIQISTTCVHHSTELFPYETSIFYTVITSLVALDRVSIKSKVVDAPEILTVIHKVPNLEPLLNSLYGCKYSSFVRVRSPCLASTH